MTNGSAWGLSALVLALAASVRPIGEVLITAGTRLAHVPHSIPCALCHGTRAFRAYFSGDLPTSIRENTLVFASITLCYVIAVTTLAGLSFSAFRKWLLAHIATPRTLSIAGIALMSLYLTQWAFNAWRDEHRTAWPSASNGSRAN